ncbi:MAG: glycosyltransferase [Planctomycetes bacterium]|nr:glycosyltransferase [Planctomycetota bacterium]
MRLLVLSAGCGAGHNRAAEAVDAAAREFFPGLASEWVDSLKYTGRVFRALYADSYIWMANHSPALWGMLYSAMGKHAERPTLDRAVKAYDKLAYRKLKEHVEAFAPDVVVCTHFLPANVVLTHFAAEAPPVFLVVTDFDVHSAWINPAAAGYFVASEQVKWQVEGYGIPADRVHVTGIPIMPAFSRRRGRAVVLREVGLAPKAPVVLMLGGGAGLAYLEEAVQRVLSVPEDMHLLVVCGRNERLKKRLEVITRGMGDRVRLFGFVTNVHDLMEAADLVISKSGGLTVSEALSRGTPMVIYMPIPGQEECNADYLLERGAAVKAKGPDTLDFKVRELLTSPQRLVRMRKAAEAIARPQAAKDVVRLALEIARRHA